MGIGIGIGVSGGMLQSVQAQVKPQQQIEVTKQTPAQKMASADQKNEAGSYKQAIKIYEDLLEDGYKNPHLFYNLANAYFHNEEYAAAILNYERVLVSQPLNKQVAHNMQKTIAKLSEPITAVPQLFIWRWWDRLALSLSANVWALICLLSAFLASWAYVRYLKAEELSNKRRAFYIMIAGLLLLLLCLPLGYKKYLQETRTDMGVVMLEKEPLRRGPTEEALSEYTVGAGNKVQVLRSSNRETMIQVVLANGEQGWVRKDAVAMIR